MTEPTFSGEVQFVTYADSSKGGPRITLRLHDRDELEAFVGMEGKRFMAVLVQIGDDEKPVPPAETKKQGAACRWLAMRCKESDFQKWAGENLLMWVDGSFCTEADAAQAVRDICEVESRSDIDQSPEALARFDRYVRKPYEAWLQGKM